MLKLRTTAVALSGAALLAACVEMKATDPPIVINVTRDGDQCRVTVLRNPFVQPLDFARVNQAQLLQIGRQAKSHRAIVVSDVNAQYKCIGAAIITLQQAGLQVDVALWDGH